jgi:hypothetical protein
MRTENFRNYITLVMQLTTIKEYVTCETTTDNTRHSARASYWHTHTHCLVKVHSHIIIQMCVSCAACHVSCVVCHVPCVKCHVSCVKCHVPCVMCRVSSDVCRVSSHGWCSTTWLNSAINQISWNAPLSEHFSSEQPSRNCLLVTSDCEQHAPHQYFISYHFAGSPRKRFYTSVQMMPITNGTCNSGQQQHQWFPVIPVTSGTNDCSKRRHQLPQKFLNRLTNICSIRRYYWITNIFATSYLI